MSVDVRLGKIHVLPGEIVSRIAAGEVIERPAAVVKELVDNSLDAGSTRIVVEVLDGGRRLIKVTDDGEGIRAADVPLAFQRHATSKLAHDTDLFSLETLGFRGEALPSIASISKVRLFTASRDESVGTLLIMDGGAVTTCKEAASPHGTHIEIGDLFFNTPARKKFLKTTGTEFSHICQVVQQAALAWPQVHFRLVHNGQEVCEYPAAGTSQDRVLQVYGLSVSNHMVMVQGELSGHRVHGMAVMATSARASRSPQELFVNHRPVKNATISHAIYEGYGVSLPKGHHPLFVLFVEVDPARVDINVHPTKREVRFADSDLVHRAVQRAIRSAVGSTGPESACADIPPALSGHTIGTSGTELRSWTDGRNGGRHSQPVGSSDFPAGQMGEQAVMSAQVVQEATSAYLVQTANEVLPFGQIRQTFLVAQVGSELHVIDQHTAHERVLFERLSRAFSQHTVTQQPLLISEPVTVPLHQAMQLQQHLSDLAKLGLDIEPFGSGTFLIRAVPALLGHIDGAALVHGLLEDLSEWSSTASFEQRMRPILATMACHSAVRAGRAMTLPEIKVLIEDWVAEGVPTTCPHGRRIALRLPAQELDKIFNR
ncbi:MAG: DNA mismatch repair endonuclease MutL [Nitrospirota bacterium]|nr:DNA mismatch repair endonuclease MutL [Nitrospirota bacterium]